MVYNAFQIVFTIVVCPLQCFSNGNLSVPRVAARVPQKQTEIAWDEICNHSSMRL